MTADSWIVQKLHADPPRAPERLRARVGSIETAALPPPSRRRIRSPRLAAGVALGTLVALAAAAALVHGLSDSGDTPRRAAATWDAAAPSQVAGGTGSAGASAAAPTRTAHEKLAPVQSGSPLTAPRLQRFEASLTVRVDDAGRLAGATAQATRVVRSLGGYAGSVEYRTPQGRPGRAFLELRVPTARVEDAVARLSALGTLLSQRVLVQDLQRDLERETAQVAQLRRAVKLYERTLRDPSLTPVQRVQLQLRLGEAKRALAERAHAQHATIAEGTLARVSLVLTTAKDAVAPVHHQGRLGRALHDAVGFLAVEATFALAALIVVSPLALLVVLVWLVVRLARRRAEQRLLAT